MHVVLRQDLNIKHKANEVNNKNEDEENFPAFQQAYSKFILVKFETGKFDILNL